mmetsp:Transcript_616/g.1515  ORF Transcript_616/g.1515 Transcript_616/m.1515 type:complete len:292 (-) Transcript_616:35-910(-)
MRLELDRAVGTTVVASHRLQHDARLVMPAAASQEQRRLLHEHEGQQAKDRGRDRTHPQQPPPIEVNHLRVVAEDQQRAIHLPHRHHAVPDACHHNAPMRWRRLTDERLVSRLTDAEGDADEEAEDSQAHEAPGGSAQEAEHEHHHQRDEDRQPAPIGVAERPAKQVPEENANEDQRDDEAPLEAAEAPLGGDGHSDAADQQQLRPVGDPDGASSQARPQLRGPEAEVLDHLGHAGVLGLRPDRLGRRPLVGGGGVRRLGGFGTHRSPVRGAGLSAASGAARIHGRGSTMVR